MTARNNSKKRDAILRRLKEVRTHPSAEYVYMSMKSEFPSISLGTVYRNLAQLREAGLIKSVGIFGGEERFDGDTSDHAHFICESCGAVHDFGEPPPVFSAASDGFRVERSELFYYGSCPECCGG
ncbi:MAG: transcriptional repressor [Oscillospiraceae bacterium]|jgi:Fur family peroxide stress response transcriptional regulator|nr:transcriptional repressor [Oscillospiraceae bacterium]